LLDEATHQAVFTFVLSEVARRGMLKGKTTRDRRDEFGGERGDAARLGGADTGESYMEYLRRLAVEAAWTGPTTTRCGEWIATAKKKTSNDEWLIRTIRKQK